MICIRNLFEPISFINRTNSRQIWTPTCENIDHNAKSPSFGPPKKNPQLYSIQRTFGRHLTQQRPLRYFRIFDSFET